LIADAQAEANAYRAARASLAAQVARAWLALTESNEQLALTSKNIALLKKTEEIVKDRFMNALTDEGGSVSELRLAQSERAAQEARLAEQAGDREVAIQSAAGASCGFAFGVVTSQARYFGGGASICVFGKFGEAGPLGLLSKFCTYGDWRDHDGFFTGYF